MLKARYHVFIFCWYINYLIIGSLLEAREKAKEESDFSDFKLNDFEKKRKVEQMANQRHPNKNKIKKSSPPVYASSTKSSSEIGNQLYIYI